MVGGNRGKLMTKMHHTYSDKHNFILTLIFVIVFNLSDTFNETCGPRNVDKLSSLRAYGPKNCE